MAGLAIVGAGTALTVWALRADPAWAEQHVLASYCATSTPEWIVARALRPLAVAMGLAAVLAAPALARALGRARLRAPTWQGAASIAVAVAAALLVGEAYLRRLHDRLADGAAPAHAGTPRSLPMTRADPRLGWCYLPSRTTWTEVGGHAVEYAIDEDGNRARTPDERPDPGLPTVLFTGESIAFGYGLRFDDTAPFLVGQGLAIQTVNLAVVGYGADQAYLRLVDALGRFARPVAVVTLFIPDQIRRSVDTWRPRLALGPGGALAVVPPASGPRLAKLLDVLPWHGDDALRITSAVLRATAETARAKGAVPLFVVTNYGSPCVHAEGDEAWIVNELLVRQGLPFVRVDLGPEDRLPGIFERHPNPRGARKIAAAVERALAERLGAAVARPTRGP